jgi:hypothetical protein
MVLNPSASPQRIQEASTAWARSVRHARVASARLPAQNPHSASLLTGPVPNPRQEGPELPGGRVTVPVHLSEDEYVDALEFVNRSLHQSLRAVDRTNFSLAKDAPDPRPVQPPSAGEIVAFREVGGLHHRYERRVE